MLRITASKRWANFSLELDLKIEPGFTALFGPSGSGKTTTLNLIAGIQKPTRGEISLSDRILFSESAKINVPPQLRNIGYIFQESRLFPHYTVRKNIEFGLNHTPAAKRRFRFNEIAEATGVEHLLKRLPADLSGGERQRVALARALLASPEYLLLDEPLAALDLAARLAFLNFIQEIHYKLDLPILYVSHDLASVLNFADQVIIINNGKVIGVGTPYSLLDKMTTIPLVSSEDISNIFALEVLASNSSSEETKAKSGDLTFILPPLKSEIGNKLILNIPASEIIIGIEPPQGLSATNIFSGQITELHKLGERILVKVDAGQGFTVEVLPSTVERLGLKPGLQVYLIIKASSFRRLSR